MKGVRAAYAALSLAAFPLFGLFYARYVPLVGPFQAALVPVLLTVFVLTLIRPVWGTLFFIFAFPLINNLPYFFGLAEPLPIAPPALVLCLSFLWAYLLRAIVVPPVLLTSPRIFRPLVLFAALVMASGLVMFARYSGFFPLVSDRVYEWTTNMHRLSAGGAIMSVTFTVLTFLTGIGLFLILVSTLRSRDPMRKAILAFSASSCLSIVFGFVQQLTNSRLGNNPLSIAGAMINGTFKDAMSFGAFLAMVAPLFIAAVVGFEKGYRFVFSGLYGGAAVAVLFTGSKSGLIVFLASSVVTGAALAISYRRQRKAARGVGPRKGSVPAIIWAAAGILTAGAVILVGVNKDRIAKVFAGSVSVGRLVIQINNFSWKNILIIRGDTLWPIAVAMIKDYPLTGVGVGGYIIEMSNYAADMKLKVDTPESAENLPLQVGSELGLVGLLVAAWIFWEIVRKIRSRWKSFSAAPRDRFLLIGLAGGLFSFVLVSQVHTFIWSYEIHYAFWLMVALVYGLGCDGASVPGESQPALPGRKSMARRAVFPVVLLVFAALHLWNSTHSLSLENRAAKYGFKQDFGFFQQEKTADGRDFRWTGKHAGTELLVEKARLEVPLLASHPDIAERPVRVRVFLVRRFFREKRLLGELTIKNSDWQTYEFALAPEDVGKSAIILFKVDRTWVPQTALRVPDPRHLGIAVGPLRFFDSRP